MFSTHPQKNFNFSVTFILSSANALNLDQSKILSSGNELIDCKIRLNRKHCGKGELADLEPFHLFPMLPKALFFNVLKRVYME